MNDFNIAVIGSGFAGSLLAMILRRSGHSVILLERGTHPRFAIGESSTPLANLLLEQLASRHGLQGVLPLAKWGAWQSHCPQVGCGLKRGFTFYHHSFGREWEETRDRQLLVAASPHDRVADTHWYRQDFDEYLVGEARNHGVEYLDHVHLESIRPGTPVTLEGRQGERPLRLRARLVIDASGPRGSLHRLLGLAAGPLRRMPPTQALFTHFRDVHRWADCFPSAQTPPYPVDDAALHHVFPGGWIWMLRFNNGLTSAGVAATDQLAAELELREGAPAWDRLLQRLPGVRAQFETARAQFPFVHQPRVWFRSQTIVGTGWAMLPSAAGFIDPLLSTGFPLTLLGIERLSTLILDHWGSPQLAAGLQAYARLTQSELLMTERLVAALYASMEDFQLFAAITQLYFAAASFTETARRLGRRHLAGPAFLCSRHATFGPRMRAFLREVLDPCRGQKREWLIDQVAGIIEPINVAGLCDPARNNWYPARSEDLLRAADKLRATPAEIQRMLEAVGFTQGGADPSVPPSRRSSQRLRH